MANGKKSFLLYTDIYHTVKKLSDEQSGKLFKLILSYVNDENPTTNDIVLDIAFEPIKQSLKRDLRKYESIREKRSLAGKASADKRQQVLTSVNQNEQVLTNPTVNDNDNDNVNVNEEIKKIDFSVFWDLYDHKVGDKSGSKRKWDKLKLSEQENIISILPAYLKTIKDKKYQPHPATWLNQKRWENEDLLKVGNNEDEKSDTKIKISYTTIPDNVI